MTNLKILKIKIGENFPALRLICAVIIISFSAVVSVYKFSDLAGAVSAGFTAYETLLLILSDIINTVFIYMPAFIFIIAGDYENFGITEVIKTGSRRGLAFSGLIKTLIYTLIFFAVLIIINGAVSFEAFPVGNSWSRAFMGTARSFGFDISVMTQPPFFYITQRLILMFFLFLTVGMIYDLFKTLSDEGAVFPLTVLIGIGLALVIQTMTAVPPMMLIFVLFVIDIILYFITMLILRVKDLRVPPQG
ncbi:MAG: hypothetical protein LBM87_02185 [Ruminococcus sp.]|jgi:hypothetical protein|nr:hypothetical protein [Ruminococcus sp.]